MTGFKIDAQAIFQATQCKEGNKAQVRVSPVETVLRGDLHVPTNSEHAGVPGCFMSSFLYTAEGYRICPRSAGSGMG